MTLEKANQKNDVWVCPKMRYTLQFTSIYWVCTGKT